MDEKKECILCESTWDDFCNTAGHVEYRGTYICQSCCVGLLFHFGKNEVLGQDLIEIINEMNKKLKKTIEKS